MEENDPHKIAVPSFGHQYAATGAISPLAERLILGEIDKEEYERLRATKSLWWKIWYEQSQTIFGAIAYTAFTLWLIFWR